MGKTKKGNRNAQINNNAKMNSKVDSEEMVEFSPSHAGSEMEQKTEPSKTE
ncbi:hypothetical protein [Falsibacillus pallidus]|uniref:hypothetical protein n=1 Tax=Falsibacillus pallidus TaxID=493781 RepID=UPI003D998060